MGRQPAGEVRRELPDLLRKLLGVGPDEEIALAFESPSPSELEEKLTAEAVKAVCAKGIVVVRSSRTNGGIIRRNIELNDDQIGTVASMELNPAKSRVLLQLALLKTKDAKAIQGYFDRY